MLRGEGSQGGTGEVVLRCQGNLLRGGLGESRPWDREGGCPASHSAQHPLPVPVSLHPGVPRSRATRLSSPPDWAPPSTCSPSPVRPQLWDHLIQLLRPCCPGPQTARAPLGRPRRGSLTPVRAAPCLGRGEWTAALEGPHPELLGSRPSGRTRVTLGRVPLSQEK